VQIQDGGRLLSTLESKQPKCSSRGGSRGGNRRSEMEEICEADDVGTWMSERVAE